MRVSSFKISFKRNSQFKQDFLSGKTRTRAGRWEVQGMSEGKVEPEGDRQLGRSAKI